MVQKALIISLIVVLIGTNFYHINRASQLEVNFNNKENEYQQIFTALERKLSSSERQRLVHLHRIDSILFCNKALIQSIDGLNKELAGVKGKYDNRTPSELEQLMMYRYNASK